MTAPVDKGCAFTVWITPPEIVDPLREAAGGFALDPATEPSNPTGAEVFFTEADDGLSRSWVDAAPRGTVWVNPPYGRGFPLWAAKIGKEAERCEALLALLPANRTETEYLQAMLRSSNLLAACWVRKRIRFLRPSGERCRSNPYPSVLYLFGDDADASALVGGTAPYARIADAMATLGVTWRLR